MWSNPCLYWYILSNGTKTKEEKEKWISKKPMLIKIMQLSEHNRDRDFLCLNLKN